MNLDTNNISNNEIYGVIPKFLMENNLKLHQNVTLI